MLGKACGSVLRDFFVTRREHYRQRRAVFAVEAPIPAGEVLEIEFPRPL